MVLIFSVGGTDLVLAAVGFNPRCNNVRLTNNYKNCLMSHGNTMAFVNSVGGTDLVSTHGASYPLLNLADNRLPISMAGFSMYLKETYAIGSANSGAISSDSFNGIT